VRRKTSLMSSAKYEFLIGLDYSIIFSFVIVERKLTNEDEE